jgi:hypothetical protein
MMVSTPAFSQIFLDGDSTDWQNEPTLIQGIDNVDGLFPAEVGAAVMDIVDIRDVKAKIVGNQFFGFIRMWGGPVWPNGIYLREHEGVEYWTSRGYYNMWLDLDNDATTGWNTAWFEAHYTPVGYLESQGVETAEPIGVELRFENGFRYRDEWEVAQGQAPVSQLETWIADYSEYDGATDTGTEYSIMTLAVPNPDSAKAMMWHGSLKGVEQEFEAQANDSLRSFWRGHAWGTDFLEFGCEITPAKEYFKQAKGADYFMAGDVIGIAAMIETPADDWGVDLSSRGEVTCPAEPMRPASITFDGEESDWMSRPVLIEDIDNVDGLFPTEVGALVTDIVDIKEVKAFINADEDALYWQIRMWAGPVWPNEVYLREHEGVEYYTSRGYYNIWLDLDNDVTTGWNTAWFEAHFTTVGYLQSQGVETAQPIGAELRFENGFRYRDEYEVAQGQAPVSQLETWAADYSEYDGATDTGSEYSIANYEATDKDSSSAMAFDGLRLSNDTVDSLLIDGRADWVAHAWGMDFIESGVSLRTARHYFKNKTGMDYLQHGDVVGFNVMTETPADDWGVDMSTRGEIVIGMASSVSDNNAGVIDGFALGNNYPNPFNPETIITYSVPNASAVSLSIFNTLGQKVRTLVDGATAAGNYKATWDGRNDHGNLLSSGIYYYTLKSDKTAITKRMVFLK